MSAESLLVILLVGLIAGWLAGQIVRGTGFGLIADMCIGIVGALIGSWLLPRLGVHLGSGVVAAIIAATIGSILLHWFSASSTEGVDGELARASTLGVQVPRCRRTIASRGNHFFSGG